MFNIYRNTNKIKKNDKYTKLFSNSMIFMFSNALSKIILALMLPLYTRFLTTQEYGIAELLTTIAQLIIPVCSLAIQDAVFRFSMDKKENSNQVLKIGLYVLFLADILLIIISFCMKWYTTLSKYNLFFLGISILTMYRQMFSLYLKAINKTFVFSIDLIIYNVSLSLINIIVLTKLNLGLSGYFWAIIISNVISLFYLSLNSNLYLVVKEKNNKNLAKEMLKYSMPLIINSISWGLTHVVDKVMLASINSTSATGIYSASSKIPSILSLIIGIFAQAWSISVIQDYQDNKDKRFYENIFVVSHIVTIISGLLILSINNNILPNLLGKNFRSAFDYSPILLLGVVFLMYSNFYSPIYAAMKKSKKIMYSALGGALINILLNTLLIPKFEIMGACIATTISYIFIALFRMIDIQRILNLNIQWRKFIFSISIYLIITLTTVYKVDGKIPFVSFLGILLIMFIYWNQIQNIVGIIFNHIIKKKDNY